MSKVIPFKIPKSQMEFVRYQVDAGHHFYDKLHQHPEWQLTWIKEGKGQLMVGDYLGRFEPGDVYLFSANMPHVFRSDPEFFSEQENKQSLGITLFFDFDTLGKHIWEVEEFAPLWHWLLQIKGCYHVKGMTNSFIQDQLLLFGKKEGLDKLMGSLHILRQLQQSQDMLLLNKLIPQKNYTETEGKRMGQVMSFILAESNRTVNLQEVADLANMSKEAFCRFFKERTGKTLTEFLSQVRIHHACQLLQETDLSVSQIAYQSGFQNLSYFNRAFKKFRGETPKEFREKF